MGCDPSVGFPKSRLLVCVDVSLSVAYSGHIDVFFKRKKDNKTAVFRQGPGPMLCRAVLRTMYF